MQFKHNPDHNGNFPLMYGRAKERLRPIVDTLEQLGQPMASLKDHIIDEHNDCKVTDDQKSIIDNFSEQSQIDIGRLKPLTDQSTEIEARSNEYFHFLYGMWPYPEDRMLAIKRLCKMGMVWQTTANQDTIYFVTKGTDAKACFAKTSQLVTAAEFRFPYRHWDLFRLYYNMGLFRYLDYDHSIGSHAIILPPWITDPSIVGSYHSRTKTTEERTEKRAKFDVYKQECITKIQTQWDQSGWNEAINAENAEEQVAALLAQGANPNICNRDGITPLFTAVEKGNLPLVQMLLDAGANPLVIDQTGKTLLTIAQEKGHREIEELIEKAGGYQKIGNTPLVEYVKQRDIFLVKYMLSTDASIDKQEAWKALTLATTDDQTEIVSALITYQQNHLERFGNEQDNYVHNALIYFIENGNLNAVKTLIECGANINLIDSRYDWNYLTLAAYYGHKEIINFFLQEGVDPTLPDKTGKSALGNAAFYKKTQVVQTLVAFFQTNGALFPNYITNALNLYIEQGNFEEINMLLANDANPSLADVNGVTPLRFAVEHNKEDAIKILVDHFNANNEHHFVTKELNTFIKEKNSPAVELLLKNGANPSVADESGVTPLVAAADCNNADAAKKLINLYKNSMEQYGDYITPAFKLLIAQKKFSAIKLLLVNGAVPNDIDLTSEEIAAIKLSQPPLRTPPKTPTIFAPKQIQAPVPPPKQPRPEMDPALPKIDANKTVMHFKPVPPPKPLRFANGGDSDYADETQSRAALATAVDSSIMTKAIRKT
jgi:uncharacterized protein